MSFKKTQLNAPCNDVENTALNMGLKNNSEVKDMEKTIMEIDAKRGCGLKPDRLCPQLSLGASWCAGLYHDLEKRLWIVTFRDKIIKTYPDTYEGRQKAIAHYYDIKD